MKKLILIIAVFVNTSSIAQPFPIDTVFISEKRFDYISISVIDSIYFFEIHNNRIGKRSNTFIYMPNSIDTLNIKVSNRPVLFGDNFFFDYNFSNKNMTTWSYSKGFQVLNFENPFFSDLGGEYIVVVNGTSKNDYSIDFFNPITNEKTTYLMFKDLHLPDISNFESDGDWGLSRPFFIDNKRAIIEIGYDINESGYNFFYFKNGNEIKLINNQLKGTPFLEGTTITINRKVVSLRLNYIEESILKTRSILLNNDLEPIGEILVRNIPTGINMQKNKFSGYFLTGYLDNDYSAVFYYELNPTLEIAMFNAFHNCLITKQVLSKFNEKELGILHNLIYAKYNYKFDSLFYQAYFKTLDFYIKLNMEQRTKEISHLLTEIDLANLELIKAAEANLKE